MRDSVPNRTENHKFVLLNESELCEGEGIRSNHDGELYSHFRIRYLRDSGSITMARKRYEILQESTVYTVSKFWCSQSLDSAAFWYRSRNYTA